MANLMTDLYLLDLGSFYAEYWLNIAVRIRFDLIYVPRDELILFFQLLAYLTQRWLLSGRELVGLVFVIVLSERKDFFIYLDSKAVFLILIL